MAGRSYLDFDLELEKLETGQYRARVLESPAGQAQCDVAFPFSELQVENFVLRLAQGRGRTRRANSGDLGRGEKFGSALFQAILGGDVASCYRTSLSLARERGAGLRVRLRLSGATELVDVPWEFLFDPVTRRFVALSVDSPIVRFLDAPLAYEPLSVDPPIRVLVVVASPRDYPTLQVEAEWARLKEALRELEQRGQVSLERLVTPTLSDFQRSLRRPFHVLHFIGHGGFDEANQDGMLVFEDEQGGGHRVSATYLSTLLHDADSLRLVVLNACEGARSSLRDQLAGVAQGLLYEGVPAVVAMQFEITDDAALTFAHEFYTAFADGYPVEAALAEARKSIFAQGNEVEWATPVLYLRSPDGAIFHIARPTASAASVGSGQLEERESSHEIASGRDGPPATGVSTEPVSPGPASGQPATERVGRRRLQRRKVAFLVAAAVLGMAVLGLVAIFAFDDGDSRIAMPDGASPESEPSQSAFPDALDPPSAVDFGGNWYTNFSELELTQTGDRVQGRSKTYGVGAESVVEGTIAGRVLSGQLGGSNAFVLELAPNGKTLMGFWEPRPGARVEWCGRRDFGDLPEGCGYQGEWQVKGFDEFAIQGSKVTITSTGGVNYLRFPSSRYGDVLIGAYPATDTLAKVVSTIFLRPAGGAEIAIRVDWVVRDQTNWDSLTGTWRQVAPTEGEPVRWCAWRGAASPPC